MMSTSSNLTIKNWDICPQYIYERAQIGLVLSQTAYAHILYLLLLSQFFDILTMRFPYQLGLSVS